MPNTISRDSNGTNVGQVSMRCLHSFPWSWTKELVREMHLSRLTRLPSAEWHRGVFHGVAVRHGENQKEEEGEEENEVDGNKEEETLKHQCACL